MAEPRTETTQPIATIEIKKGLSRLAINPHGARIEELTLKGQKILTKVRRADLTQASTHPCIPIFGPETTTRFGIPQHGSARKKDFDVSIVEGHIILSQEIVDGQYPKGLSIRQVHSLSEEEYSLTTIVSNSSTEALPVNFAEHFYWDTPGGWGGLIINGKDVEDIVRRDGAIPALKGKNVIHIPLRREIILDAKGFSILQLWTGKNPEGKFDQHYVCIEPAEGNPAENFFGSKDSMIKPQQSRTTEIKISLQ
ncbi:MAG: hypothetical protein Q7R31_00285 [Candidatus Levybacteria bacterium]|nr:hypothetical protein [Candidatus Levybacteria bacterium]